MQITWDEGAAIASNPFTFSYRVFLDDLSGNPPAKVFDSESQSLTNIFTLINLMPGSTYKVTVTAVNAIGESDPSSALTIHAGTVPSKIRTLIWEASTTTSITVRWEAPVSNGNLSLESFILYIDEGRTGTPSQTITITDTFQRT